MKITLIILIGIHGIIHLFGFFKAFGISEFNEVSQPISKTFGILWLLTFVLFTITIVLLITQSNYWWIIGIVGVILSQFLIINYWNDAKFGTILNLIILVSTIIAYSTFSFKKNISDETSKMFENADTTNKKVLSEQMISDESTEKIISFSNSKPYNFNFLKSVKKLSEYGINESTTLPTTYFYDAQGNLIVKHSSDLNLENLTEFVE